MLPKRFGLAQPLQQSLVLSREKIIEALHDPAAEVCILPECPLDTLVGNRPLTPTDKYFKSPSGLYFECRGIARDVPIIIDKIEVHLDFYIYNILDFDLRLGLPLEKLLASHGSLDEKLRETGSATATPCLENLLAKPLPEQNPWEFWNPLKNMTRKIAFTFMKMNAHHHP